MSTVNEFSITGTINSKHNSTFITPVPKKDHIETIKYCRPICLLTSVYKIIAKVLDTRLKLVMDKLISPVQCAYIEGRQIIDGTLIANELVDSRLRSGNAGIVCKIDLEKDFDRINWKYLDFVLKQMGFSRKLCNWLNFCYSTSSFSVLINGSPFGYFTSTRGVRQGCPVSPLLFNIAMEDDTIFFVDHKKEELHNLFSALHCFEFITGLKVNTSKTRLITVGDVPELSLWAEEVGCTTDSLPFMYMGMPLGAKSGSKGIWDPIIEKFDARLSIWRRISLSKGGNRIAFWNDIWCGQQSLTTLSPNLYKLARDKDVRIADMIFVEGNWRFDFKRVLTNSEVGEYATLLTVIGDIPPVRDQLSDTRRWKLHPSGVFSVKTLYRKLVESYGIENFPYLFVWKAVVPPKINLFVWSLVHGRLNPKDVLLRKGIELDNSCVLCGDDLESQSNLFLHCKVAFRVWSQLLPTSRYSWVIPKSVMQLSLCWHNTTFTNNGNCIWNLIPVAIFWSLWKERNNCTFDANDIFKIYDDLVNEVKTSILLWAAAAGNRVHVNFSSAVIND
ncbi:uncharacterized protein LOC113294010 [Papaver somniferum]|uniref:uncharacterized protein LOC113294010 n=1 Tax=Papaver somniferum TaxID=3469 RepID=UPI000E6FFDEC|nr:uncharacterized protein LOC113294010 [Papaver somniferum]